MSNLRNKAAEIRAKGAEERGNFEPTGVPLRMYNYWLEESVSKKSYSLRAGHMRENFCHFWRVVAIWAPLLFVGRKVLGFVESKAGLVTIGAMVLLALVIGGITSSGFLEFLLIVLAAVAFVGAMIGLGIGLALLHQKFWRKSWNRIANKVFIGFLIALMAGAVIALIVALFVDFGWWALAGIAGFIAFFAAVAFGIIFLADFISARRADKRAERARIEDEWIKTGEGPNPFITPVREPGMISKFFSGVADFLVLTFQIIRVKKWKICPMVDVKQ